MGKGDAMGAVPKRRRGVADGAFLKGDELQAVIGRVSGGDGVGAVGALVVEEGEEVGL